MDFLKWRIYEYKCSCPQQQIKEKFFGILKNKPYQTTQQIFDKIQINIVVDKKILCLNQSTSFLFIRRKYFTVSIESNKKSTNIIPCILINHWMLDEVPHANPIRQRKMTPPQVSPATPRIKICRYIIVFQRKLDKYYPIQFTKSLIKIKHHTTFKYIY